MRLVRFAPNRDLVNFEDMIDRFFGGSQPSSEGLRSGDTSSFWTPAVDLRENEKEVVFAVELPGFEKNEIDLSLNNGVLTISGERRFDEEHRGEYRRVERWYGKFHRSFRLPDSVNPEKIEANLSNGVLRIRLPRREEALPRQIEVKVS